MVPAATVKVKVYVTAKVTVAGFHWWPEAPEAVRYLRNPHRHLFVIRADKAVSNDNREVEFHMLKGMIEERLRERWPEGQFGPGTEKIFNFGTDSCERIAAVLLEAEYLSQCSVLEDDENGAIVQRDA
jgi:hypothetical protein